MTQSNSSPRWDLGRFAKTLAYFGAIPGLSQLDWFQHWLGSRPDPTVDDLQLKPASVLVIGDRSSDGEGLVQRLAQAGVAARSLRVDEFTQLDAEQGYLDGKQIVAISPDSAVVKVLAEALNRGDRYDEVVLFDFAQPTSDLKETWGALDDVVMGVVSHSDLSLIPGGAVFAGVVSTANSGGFASVRSRNINPPLDLSAYEGFAFHIQGDGQRYKFLARCEDRWDGVAYSTSFDTDAKRWMTVRRSFQELIPVFRARTLKDCAPIDARRIVSLQFMLSKFEYDGALNPAFTPGPFRLNIGSISAYRAAQRPAVIWVGREETPLIDAQTSFANLGISSVWSTPNRRSDNVVVGGAEETLMQICAAAIAS